MYTCICIHAASMLIIYLLVVEHNLYDIHINCYQSVFFHKVNLSNYSEIYLFGE